MKLFLTSQDKEIWELFIKLECFHQCASGCDAALRVIYFFSVTGWSGVNNVFWMCHTKSRIMRMNEENVTISSFR